MEIIAALMLIISVVSFFILLMMLMAPQVILDLSDGAMPPTKKSILKVGIPVVSASLVIALLMLPSSFFRPHVGITQSELVLSGSHVARHAKKDAVQKETNNLTDADLDEMLQQAQGVIEQHQAQVMAKR